MFFLVTTFYTANRKFLLKPSEVYGIFIVLQNCSRNWLLNRLLVYYEYTNKARSLPVFM